MNPFNFIWTGSEIKLVDLGSLRVGPAFADLDILKRLCFKEEQILEIQEAYLDFRKALGAPVEEPSDFIKGIAYWSVADALMAAASFQMQLEGQKAIKETLSPKLRRFANFRDDVLADVWTIAQRQPELREIAKTMEEFLPAEICQPRWKRHASLT